MKILFVGGGTGGSVTPMLAVAEEIKKTEPHARFLLVGGSRGPERAMAAEAGIPFASIPAGKWRRYFSLANFLTPFGVLAGFVRSLRVLKDFKPDCVFGTGSFVQVPLVWAAWLLGIPAVLHQQDLVSGLANKLCQMPASRITVTFEHSLTDFSSGLGLLYKKRKTDKIILTGNPFRQKFREATREQGIRHFHLKPDLPVLYAVGGGTGAEYLNTLILQALPSLAKTVQIIHSTGRGKTLCEPKENYHPYEFIDNPGLAYAAADIVLCRAGLSTITELSNLEKVSIIVPMPDSHQVFNANLLAESRAAVVIRQERLHPGNLITIVRRLLFQPEIQKEIRNNIAKVMPKNAGKRIAEIILEMTKMNRQRRTGKNYKNKVSSGLKAD